MSTNYYGVLNTMLNTEFGNAPSWMREEAVYRAFKIYDRMWQPKINEVLPRTPAPLANGQVCSIEDEFFVPVVADPQIISRFYDDDEDVKPLGVGFKRERFQGRMTKQWMPPAKSEEFENQFKAGFLDMRNAFLTDVALKSVERRVELEGVNYVAMNATTIAQYSDQPTTRGFTFDASEATSTEADYLSGAAWDNWDADPMHDINKINRNMLKMCGKEVKRGFIGPNTSFGLRNNAKIKEQVKYFVDATQQVIGASILGVKMEVIAQMTSKDRTANSGKMGYPGLGDLQEDNWSDRNKFDFMTHVDSAVTYEYALFLPDGPIGNTFCLRTNKKHTDVTVPYGRTWMDPRTEKTYSNIQFGFAPSVEDFANVIKVNKIATHLV